VHAPWEEDRRFYQKYIDEGLTRPEAIRASMIESMDRSLGDLMDSLDRLGVADNTLLLFVSDNGAPHAVPLNLPLRGQETGTIRGWDQGADDGQMAGGDGASSISHTPVIIEDLFRPFSMRPPSTGERRRFRRSMVLASFQHSPDRREDCQTGH
jgi:hypothetical protein